VVASSPAAYRAAAAADSFAQQPAASTVQAISAALTLAEDAVHLDEEGRVDDATVLYQQCVDTLKRIRGAESEVTRRLFP
jgi:hypothetical protein